MIRWLRLFGILTLLSLVAACGTMPVHDSAADVARAAYVDHDPPSLTLITMVNNRTGVGGHSALMINTSQRVMYDPAGRFKSPAVAEQNDLLYGITPQVLRRYESFHARRTHHVVMQTVDVTPEVAAKAFELAKERGTSWDAMCAFNVTRILARVPGFEHMGGSMFPARLMEHFAAMPGVQTQEYYENDDGQH